MRRCSHPATHRCRPPCRPIETCAVAPTTASSARSSARPAGWPSCRRTSSHRTTSASASSWTRAWSPWPTSPPPPWPMGASTWSWSRSRCPPVRDLAAGAARATELAPAGPRLFVELPRTAGWRDGARRPRRPAAAAPSSAPGACAPTCSPPMPSWRAFITACAERAVAFKCTAGLHHAVRHDDPATGFRHHGFLNIVVATGRAAGGEPARGGRGFAGRGRTRGRWPPRPRRSTPRPPERSSPATARAASTSRWPTSSASACSADRRSHGSASRHRRSTAACASWSCCPRGRRRSTVTALADCAGRVPPGRLPPADHARAPRPGHGGRGRPLPSRPGPPPPDRSGHARAPSGGGAPPAAPGRRGRRDGPPHRGRWARRRGRRGGGAIRHGLPRGLQDRQPPPARPRRGRPGDPRWADGAAPALVRDDG